MVAIFTGLGAGFERGSANILGGAGQVGSSLLGRGGESVSVNAATGNLLINHQDEFLIGRGPDVGISRTYNSLEDATDRDNLDHWQQSTTRRVLGYNAGVSVQRLGADGALITYNFVSGNLYRSKDGSGAHDTLELVGSEWVWTDGSSQVQEVYQAAQASGEYRITTVHDTEWDATLSQFTNQVSFQYEAGTDKLLKVTTANGEWVQYHYDGNGRIDRIETGNLNGTGVVNLTRTHYSYYTDGRLKRVTTDLSPDDNSIATGATYWIEYAYDGSGRVNSITQTDGSSLAITYDGSNRVATLTQTVASGVTRVTTLSYFTGYTTITGPDNQVTRLDYDGAGQLTKITAPAAYSGATAQTVQFAYDADGNLDTVTDGNGKITSYDYDASGNNTLVTDPTSHTVTRTYDSGNRLITELAYGADESSANAAHYAQYAYDSEGHLRFAVSASGQVTEYRYTTAGQLSRTISYAEHSYSVGASAITEAAMTSWVAGLGTVVSAKVTENIYDARGNLLRTTSYSDLDINRVGNSEFAGTAGWTVPYDPNNIAVGDLATEVRYGKESLKLSFSATGSGQLITVGTAIPGTVQASLIKVTAGERLAIQTGVELTGTVDFADLAVHYFDKDGNYLSGSWVARASGNQPYDTKISGFQDVPPNAAVLRLELYVYASGSGVGSASMIEPMVSQATDGQSVAPSYVPGLGGYVGANPETSVSRDYYTYDQAGKLLDHYRPGENHETFLYDGMGRLYSSTDKNGGTTTIVFADASTTTTITSARGYATTETFNKAGELIATTGSGDYDVPTAAAYKYDSAGRLRVVTTGYFQNPDLTVHTDVRNSYIVYDHLDRKVADINHLGDIVEYRYDQAGRLIASIAYATRLGAAELNNFLAGSNFDAEFPSLRPASNPSDIWSWNIYDDAGRLIQAVDNLGSTVAYTYDNQGRLVKTTAFFNTIVAGTVAGFRTTLPTALTLPITHAKDTVTRAFYNKAGQMVGALDGEGYLSETVYDSAGLAIETIAYATPTAAGDRATGSFATLRDYVAGSSLVDRVGRSVYDGQGLLRYSINAKGGITGFNYDGAGRLVQTTQYATELTLSDFTYDAVKAAVTATAADRTSWMVYDAAGRAAYTVDAEGGVTAFKYDVQGNAIKAIAYNNLYVTGSLPALTTMDSWAANAAQANDTANRLTRNYYGAANTLRFTIDAENYVTFFSYDPQIRLTELRRYAEPLIVSDSTSAHELGWTLFPNPNCISTVDNYDGTGRLLSRVDGEGILTYNTYNALGQLTDVTAAHGTADAVTTHYTYDGAGRVLTVTAAYGTADAATVTYAYDGLGNRTQVTDARNNATSYAYDKLGRVVTITDALGGVTAYQYDSFGNVVNTTDPAGNGSFAYYDRLNRLVATRDAEGFVTYTTYNRFGEVLTTARYAIAMTGSGEAGVVFFDPDDMPGEQVDPFVYAAQLQAIADGLDADADAAEAAVPVLQAAASAAAAAAAAADALVEDLEDEIANYSGGGSVSFEAERTAALASASSWLNTRSAWLADAADEVDILDNSTNGLELTELNYHESRYDQESSFVLSVYGQNGTPALRAAYINKYYDSLTWQANNLGADRSAALADRLAWLTDREQDLENWIDGYATVSGGQISPTQTTNYLKKLWVQVRAAIYDINHNTYSTGWPTSTSNINSFYTNGKNNSAYVPSGISNTTQQTSTYRAGVVINAYFDVAEAVGEPLGGSDPAYAALLADLADAQADAAAAHAANTAVQAAAAAASGTATTARAAATAAQADADAALAAAQSWSGEILRDNFVLIDLATLGGASRSFYSYDKLGRVTQKVDAEGYVETSDYNAFGQLIAFSRYEKSVYGSYGGQTGVVQEAFAAAFQAQVQADALAAAATAADAAAATALAAKNAAQTAYNAAQATATASAANVASIQAQITSLTAQKAASPLTTTLASPSSYLQSYRTTLQSQVATLQNQINAETAYAMTLPPEQQYYYYLGVIMPLEGQKTVLNAEISAVTTEITSVANGNPLSQSYYGIVLGMAGYTTQQITDYNTLITNLNNAQGSLAPAQAIAATDAAAAAAAQTALNQATSAYNAAVSAATTAHNTATTAQNTATAAVTAAQQLEAGVGISDQLPAFALGQLDGAATTLFEYDNRGSLKKTTDAEGFYESYTYDAFGRRNTSVGKSNTGTVAAGGTTTYAYDKRGLLLSETLPIQAYDSAGNTTGAIKTTYQYDTRGNLTLKSELEGATVKRTTIYTYDKLNRLKTTAGDTIATGVTIDASTKAVSNQSSAAPTETITYDANGNVITIVDAAGAMTQFAYDKLNRKVAELNAVGTLTAYAYDANGNVTDIRVYDAQTSVMQNSTGQFFSTVAVDLDGLAAKVHRLYDIALGRSAYSAEVADWIWRMINLYGNSPTALESICGEILGDSGVQARLSPTNNTQFVTQMYQLGFHRAPETWELNLWVNALGSGTTRAYMLSVFVDHPDHRAFTDTAIRAMAYGSVYLDAIDPAKYRETSFTYDHLGRMLTSSVVLPSGYKTGTWNGSAWTNDTTTALTTTYQYDYLGNVVKVIDPTGNATFAYYDQLGRKTAQIDGEGYRTDWTYDSDGNVLSERRWANKPAGTPTVTEIPAGSYNAADRVTNYTYDRNGNRTSEARLNVVVHNGTGGTTTVTSTISYLYNGLGQVVQKNEATDNGNAGVIGDESFYYTYDAGGRLMQEVRPVFASNNGTNVSPTLNYFYNGLGDLTRTVQAAGGDAAQRVTTYTYGAGGRLASVTDPENGVRNYLYDVAGRLVLEHYTRAVMSTGGSTTNSNEAIGYRYDVLGRSLGQGFYTKPASTWTFASSNDWTATEYNSFGDVSRTGLNGIWQQESKYDAAGRVWATNSGDGVWKYFGYDKNGNQTVAITSAGANTSGKTFTQALGMISAADTNGTYTVYDKRNMATGVVEEGRQLTTSGTSTLTTSRSYNAFGEVASESNALGATVTYSYNTMGRMTRSESPAVEITREDGSKIWVKPSEDYYYDASGRLVATRDASEGTTANSNYGAGGTNAQTATSKLADKGNLTRLTLLAGTGYGESQALVVKQTNADGGITENSYNVFGEVRTSRILVSGNGSTPATDVWLTTTQTFDKLGRLLTATRPGGSLTDNYTYDILGQQISHWNSYYGSSNREYTTYDIQGRITATRGFGGTTGTLQGDIVTYAYSWDGTLEAAGTGLTDTGGWSKLTSYIYRQNSTDTTVKTTTEKTDVYGRMIQKTDMGGHVTNFTYDIAGRLTQSAIGSTSYNYQYYNTGQVKQANTIAPNWDYYTSSATVATAGSFATTTTQSATYTYDAAGKRLTEIGTLTNGGTNITFKSHTVTYDALGRLKTDTLASNPVQPDAAVAFEYDANGNIRKKSSTFQYFNAEGGVGSGAGTTKDAWYRYDSMNRVVINNGVMQGGTIVLGIPVSIDFLGDPSQSIAYNKAGQRTLVTTNKYYETYVAPMQTPYGYFSGAVVTYLALTPEEYIYDSAGRLYQVKVTGHSFDSNSWLMAGITGYNYPPEVFVTLASSGALHTQFGYDAMGRQTSLTSYNSAGTSIYNTTTTFNAKGQVSNTYASTLKTDNKTYTQSVTNQFGSGATYALGAVLSFTSVNTTTGQSTKTSSTTNTYQWWDGAVQSTISYDSDTGDSGNAIWTTTFTYNGLGQLTKTQINDGQPRTVTFTLDEVGQIIRRDETRPSNAPAAQTGSPHELWYRFGDREIGYIGNNGGEDATVSGSRNDLQRVAGSGTFRFGGTSGRNNIGFAQALDPINLNEQGSVKSGYTVRSGDTLEAIAQRLYGDAGLWYKIAEVNGLSGGASLIAGQQIQLPSGVTRNTYTDKSYRPYDPAQAMGDLSPSTPKPAKKPHCGLLGQILLAAIAIGVAAWLGPGIMGAFEGLGSVFGTAAGLAATGAVSSIASQAVGVATGIQDKFSWKQVGISAIRTMVGGPPSIGDFITDVAWGAVTEVITQGWLVATGLQRKFDWAGVAAAGVAGGVGGQFLESGKVVRAAASTIAYAATRSAITGESFGRNLTAGATNAVAQMLGQALGEALGDAFAGGGKASANSSAGKSGNAKATPPENSAASMAQAKADGKVNARVGQVAANNAQVQGDPSSNTGGDDTPGEIVVSGSREAAGPRPAAGSTQPANELNLLFEAPNANPPIDTLPTMEEVIASLEVRSDPQWKSIAKGLAKKLGKVAGIATVALDLVWSEELGGETRIPITGYSSYLALDHMSGIWTIKNDRPDLLQGWAYSSVDAGLVEGLDNVFFLYGDNGQTTANGTDDNAIVVTTVDLGDGKKFQYGTAVTITTIEEAYIWDLGLAQGWDGRRISNAISDYRANGRVAEGDRPAFVYGEYTVDNHGNMPSPRPGQHSHHGALSAWMEAHYENYDPKLAPAVLMSTQNHEATYGVLNKWRAEQERALGRRLDWAQVPEADMRKLSERMFDAASVPDPVRIEYWIRYHSMKEKLSR